MEKVTVHIENGKILNKKVVANAFNLPDGPYTMKIEKRKNDRSFLQNRYYWGVCVPMVKEGLRYNGYNEVQANEDAHEVLKSLFLKKNIGEAGAQKIIEITGSTTNLTTVEFGEFLEAIGQWAAEFLNVVIPAPNTQTELQWV